MSRVKKLVLVLPTSAPLTEASKKDDVVLDQILCIHYLIQFKKNEIQVLINPKGVINAITPAYTSKLGLKVRCTNIGAYKIDGFILKTFKMVLASF